MDLSSILLFSLKSSITNNKPTQFPIQVKDTIFLNWECKQKFSLFNESNHKNDTSGSLSIAEQKTHVGSNQETLSSVSCVLPHTNFDNTSYAHSSILQKQY